MMKVLEGSIGLGEQNGRSSDGPQSVLRWSSVGPQVVLTWSSDGPQLTRVFIINLHIHRILTSQDQARTSSVGPHLVLSVSSIGPQVVFGWSSLDCGC